MLSNEDIAAIEGLGDVAMATNFGTTLAANGLCRISERKGTDPHWKHLRCTVHTLCLIVRHRDVIASLACVRLTGWPVT